MHVAIVRSVWLAGGIIRLSLISGGAVVALMSSGAADDHISGAADRDAAAEQAEYVLRAMIDSRERLRSGRCDALGWMREEHAQLGVLEGELAFVIVFDFDAEHYRIDRTAPYRYSLLFDAEGSQLAAQRREDWELRTERSAYLDRNDLTAHWCSWSPRYVGIHPPGSRDGEGLCHPFDFRQLGLVNLHTLDRLQERRFPKAMAAWLKRPPGLAETLGGLFKVRYHQLDDYWENERVIWLDASCGHSPVRYESRSRYRLADGGFGDWRSHVAGDVTWTEIDGVWVPDTFHMQDDSATSGLVTWDLIFRWHGINQPVDPALFEPQNLTTEFARLTDDRLGRSIVVGTTRPSELEEKSAPIRQQMLLTRPVPQAAMTNGRWWLLAFNLGLAVAFVIYLTWSRFRRLTQGRCECVDACGELLRASRGGTPGNAGQRSSDAAGPSPDRIDKW